jgi:hypothetical protein
VENASGTREVAERGSLLVIVGTSHHFFLWRRSSRPSGNQRTQIAAYARCTADLFPPSGKSLGNGSSRTLVVLWVNHETAIRAFAFAFGLKIGFVAQGQVDDAALARRHRAEVVRSPSLADFLGGDVGCGAQFLNAHGAPILAVEADLLVFAGGEVQHLEREQFKRAQQLSAAIEQQRGVGAGEVDEDFRLFPIAILRERRVDNNAVPEVKTAVSDDGLKELVDLIGGSDFVHKAAFGYLGLKPQSLFASDAALKRRSSTCYLSFFLARLAIISRISRPSDVRFITACCAIWIKLLIA